MDKLIKFTYSNGETAYFRRSDIFYITNISVVFTKQSTLVNQEPNNIDDIVMHYNL